METEVSVETKVLQVSLGHREDQDSQCPGGSKEAEDVGKGLGPGEDRATQLLAASSPSPWVSYSFISPLGRKLA